MRIAPKPAINRTNHDATAISARRLPGGNPEPLRRDNHRDRRVNADASCGVSGPGKAMRAARKFGWPTGPVVVRLELRIPLRDAGLRLPAAGLPQTQDLRAGPTSNHGEDSTMRKHLLVAAASLAFGAAVLAVPVQAQDNAGKGTTSQQQKMKDCAAKWKDEKAQKHVSGRTAYSAFMKDCLKG